MVAKNRSASEWKVTLLVSHAMPREDLQVTISIQTQSFPIRAYLLNLSKPAIGLRDNRRVMRLNESKYNV